MLWTEPPLPKNINIMIYDFLTMVNEVLLYLRHKGILLINWLKKITLSIAPWNVVSKFAIILYVYTQLQINFCNKVYLCTHQDQHGILWNSSWQLPVFQKYNCQFSSAEQTHVECSENEDAEASAEFYLQQLRQFRKCNYGIFPDEYLELNFLRKKLWYLPL